MSTRRSISHRAELVFLHSVREGGTGFMVILEGGILWVLAYEKYLGCLSSIVWLKLLLVRMLVVVPNLKVLINTHHIILILLLYKKWKIYEATGYYMFKTESWSAQFVDLRPWWCGDLSTQTPLACSSAQ